MLRLKCVRAALVLPVSAALAQSGAPFWSVGPIHCSGLVDGYYSANLNHPAARLNQLRNFDVNANQFSLNMAKMTLEMAPDPLGFRLDPGFGRAFDIVHGVESGPGVLRNLGQAYVAFKPPKAGGLQVDFGKFVTPAGAEVMETDKNWNYSRSLLFAWAIPYYHFGARATAPLGKHFSGGVYLVNGWNNVEDNNPGKTAGFTGTATAGKWSLAHTYLVGPERAGERGLRQLHDTVLSLAASPRTGFYLNFDYGADRIPGGGSARWLGVAGAARLALTGRLALAPRLEWFNDADGFTTGAVQKLKEATITAEMKFARGALARLEYRRDWSNAPFFDRGALPRVYRNQATVLLGFVALFGPKR